MSLILDASATVAWVYLEERSEAVAATFDRVFEGGAFVPSLWRLEVANVLQLSIRRGRHTTASRDAILADLALFPIQIDRQTDDHAWNTTLKLADVHRLTLYDAAYLELAIRKQLPLATLDEALRKAAKAEQVELLGK